MKIKIAEFIKRETVLVISLVLAITSMILVLPDAEYAGYIDYRTLGILLSLMLVMSGFRELGIFERFGNALLGKVKSIKGVAAVLVFLCFFTSMFITNDVALLTFVPFSMVVLSMAEADNILCSVVAMQTVAANLGSMLLPFGNPQNLYLYGISGLSMLEFITLLLPFGIVSFVLLLMQMQFLPKGNICRLPRENAKCFGKKEKISLMSYILLFLISILSVARIIPWQGLVIVVCAAVLVMNKRLFLKADYSLLFTFVFFFIFIGNIGRIPEFAGMLADIMEGHEMITAVLASQCISNVPAALLLSGFTGEYQALLIGCNLGGLGTLIASMASLISYKQIALQVPEKKGKYFWYFTVTNVVYLGTLLILYYVYFMIYKYSC